MLGEKAFVNYCENYVDVTINEIKLVKKVFKEFERLEKYEKKMEDNTLSEKERESAKRTYVFQKNEIRKILLGLRDYEVEYGDWEKSLPDEKKLMILKEIYDEYHDSIFNIESDFRLKEKPPCSRRAAYKDLEKHVKMFKKRDPMFVKVFMSKSAETVHEEEMYQVRDWLLSNDFEKMIDEIEPVRRQYIISKQGEVTVEEVQKMINEKFPEKHEDYEFFLPRRQWMKFLYYPDLKL